MEPVFKRAVIAGVGLIGGSLALAGKKAGLFAEVVGLSRNPATISKAVELGLIDAGSVNLDEAAAGADFFFAATPVGSIAALCLKAAPLLKDGAVITDGGSVKGEIVAELEAKLPKRVRFVGGHPVAGTEKSGPEAAFPTLFENRYTILTPTETTDKEALDAVRTMWKNVGSRVVTMSAQEHDAALALISHLPHLAAYALVDTLNELDASGEIRRFVAGGFKDTTRIAASDPKMWRDIFSMNRGEAIKSIEAFEEKVGRLKRMIEQGDFDALEKSLRHTRETRLKMDNQ